MKTGLYEKIINVETDNILKLLNPNEYLIERQQIESSRIPRDLALYIFDLCKTAIGLFEGEHSLQKQILLTNKLISLLDQEFKGEFTNYKINDAELLHAILSKLNPPSTDLALYLKEITPSSGLTQGELFTGSKLGLSLDSEIRKEISSSNEIYLLISFIKWSGLRIFERELRSFTERGGKLKIITTTYMGVTDPKAIIFLASLQNTEVKVSYNRSHERLHAKSYMFIRDTGYSTAYIGSSNMTRSALTNGLEWNIKLTSVEAKHLIDKFRNTFITYWSDPEFEQFTNNEENKTKLESHLNSAKMGNSDVSTFFLDVRPHKYQEEILEALESERVSFNRYRNLIVAATGTGKTLISAFDFKRFYQANPNTRLLYVAHRKEILEQARSAFRQVLHDGNFGELWVDGETPTHYNFLFASVQTLYNNINNIPLTSDYYSFIIIDEVHHIAADSYRPVLKRFQPKVLLGLTATPERMDGKNILEDFDNRIAAEIRLPDALNRKLLCPFQYFGITDNVDLSRAEWKNGKYVISSLEDYYINNSHRTVMIVENMKKYLTNIFDVCALCYCVSVKHAEYMAKEFKSLGLKAEYLTGQTNSFEREQIKHSLVSKEINYLFVVDIFNEGVDIPGIDTLLFLRPTESLTIFLQQFGRGLRIWDGKDFLTVLDFVGNARPEYDFERKFRALIGKTNNNTQTEIEKDFPQLPLGCSIILEKKAKEIILENINRATSFNRKSLVNKIRHFKNDTDIDFNLENFLDYYNIPIKYVYKFDLWSQLCHEAGLIQAPNNVFKEHIHRAIKKWLSCRALTYFEFIKNIIKGNFTVNESAFTEEEKLMLLMLHYDLWGDKTEHANLKESLFSFANNKILQNEMIEVLTILENDIKFLEIDIELPFANPLKVHSRYTREQILAALQISTFERKVSNREGVAVNKDLNMEVLFIDLIKSEKDFSPTTLYKDYAISETLFHWQSQNSAGPSTPKGMSYITQIENGKIVLLFVREKNKDEYGNTTGYVFLGPANFKETYGAKPMNITWELNEPIPPYLWQETAKLSTA